MTKRLDGPDAVAAQPDGTLISWLRVPDDESSRAVAFVRHHADEAWISPGIGTPRSIDTIETFPVTVVAGPDTDSSLRRVLRNRHREVALECATSMACTLRAKGIDVTGNEITAWADNFAAWLGDAR